MCYFENMNRRYKILENIIKILLLKKQKQKKKNTNK